MQVRTPNAESNRFKTISFTETPIVQATVKAQMFKTQTCFSPVTHKTSSVSNWRSIVAMDSHREKARNARQMTEVLTPKPIQPPVEDMKRSFDGFESYRREMSPQASGVEYKTFLGSMQASI